ncbi:hypothetical protein GB928_014905 [Shinella curvata]|uniref:Uncharacterized protein n=1 Tax=Shinella curvata TaxID=1817964 RepID=A0ABT8XGY3_9HYPH|nr:hypothetical protein [Shinella curvata]MCJ8053149.1 hypothetical protein [Shinella curvata]MDO6122480.1 hypothetical protein [Shinella curvata]
MIVLEEGTWSVLSCGSRMVMIPLFKLTGFILLGILFAFLHWLRNWIRGKEQPNYRWIKSPLAIVLGTSLFIGIGWAIAASPSITRFATDGSILIETGCQMTETYSKRIPLAEANITYRHTKSRRGKNTYSLIVNNKEHTVTLDLTRQQDYSALARLRRNR